MFDDLREELMRALTLDLDQGLASELAGCLQVIEERVAAMEFEHPQATDPPPRPTESDAVQEALRAAGIEPPALHLGGSPLPAALPATPAPPLAARPYLRAESGRVVAGLSARIREDGTVRVEGKDVAGRAVARTVQDALAMVMRQEITGLAAELLDLAVKVEVLETQNAELRRRLAALL